MNMNEKQATYKDTVPCIWESWAYWRTWHSESSASSL